VTACVSDQGQEKLVDHVKKSYSVGDISVATGNTAVFDNNQEERHDESDDEFDNRLLAEQYNRDVAEMTTTSTDAQQRPLSSRG